MIASDSSPLSFRRVDCGGVELNVGEAGPSDAPTILLLHGFPEFWFGWHRQVAPLVSAGFRVLVPDQCGYNLSDKPRSVGSYGLDVLSAQMEALLEQAGADTVTVAGHDWGGAVAWWMAVSVPQRVRRLVIVNCPHPMVLRRRIREDRVQRKRSWYIFLFQLPWLPERWLRSRNWARGAAALQKTSRPGTFSAETVETYREAWRQPGAARGMINWYRAAVRCPPARRETVRVRQPTLLLWGERDRFLGKELADLSMEKCDEGQIVRYAEATHWLQHEEPAEVTRRLAEFAGDEEPR